MREILERYESDLFRIERGASIMMGMIPNPILDAIVGPGRIARMFQRLIDGAVRSSFEELLRQPLQGIRKDIGDIRGDIGEIKEGQKRIEIRIDVLGERLDTRIDRLGERLDGRIDGVDRRIGELATQQGRMVEEIASLKRDQNSADVLERRVARIEDRLFAHAG